VTIIIDTMYTLTFTNTAKSQYEKLNNRLRKQVDKGLERIVHDPSLGKPLRGELKGIFSERVATFRILYKIRKAEIEVLVLVIEHRKSVYGGH
jgi:mRNA interferase RelE/StbE